MSIEKGKVLGILGGLGPMATAYFYQMLVAHTKAAADQEHIDTVISSKATTPDRSDFILGKSEDDPFVVMEAEAQRLVTFGAQVIAIPCNTAHYFYTRLDDVIPVPVLNMVALTVQEAKRQGCQKVGILATDGTVQTETYQRMCRKMDVDCLVPDAPMQRDIMDVIYNDVKAGRPPDMAKFDKVADWMFVQDCQRLVLGCTELSLLKQDGFLDARYVDSMEVLAEAAIRACGKTPQGFESTTT